MEDSEWLSLSYLPKAQNGGHHGYPAPSLSIDSGTYSADPSQMIDSSDNFRDDDEDFCDQTSMNGFSEEELLNMTFEACGSAGRGQILVSSVVQYLRAMTGHSPGQDKLTVLKFMLDPEDKDPLISRDTFHATMRKWIAQCSQDRLCDNNLRTPGLDSSKGAGNVNETTFAVQAECHRESSDLLTLVSELKQAQHSLSGQNCVLLNTLSQCEETNLQLTLEVSELRSKLASAQRFVARAHAQSEELEETRGVVRESQERAARTQAQNHTLMKESEHLKAYIKVTEEMNVKLTLERNCAEDQLNKLSRANGSIKEELKEARMFLEVREQEMTRNHITLQNLKDTYLEQYKIIESLQSELLRLQELSYQALLRIEKHSLSSSSLQRGCVPNIYSLRHEILEAQSGTCVEENSGSLLEILPPRGDRQNFTHNNKFADLRHDIHMATSETGAVCDYTGKTMARTSSKQQFLTVLSELDLPRVLWEDQELRLTEATQKARGAAGVTWRRALRLGAEGNRMAGEPQEAARALQEQVWPLEAEISAANREADTRRQRPTAMERMLSALRDAQNRAEAHRAIQRKDVAVAKELTGDVSGGNTDRQHMVAASMLKSLRQVEVAVGGAMHATQLVDHTENGQRERMEAVSQRVEEALKRSAESERQLSALEGQVSSNTLFSDISAHPDVRSVDDSYTMGESTAHTELESVSRPCSSNPTFLTNGGLSLHTGAKDYTHKNYANHEESQDTNDPTQTPQANSLDLWVNCANTVTSETSTSDPFLVGLVNDLSSPVQSTGESCSAVTQSPLPETSPGPACDKFSDRFTPESVASPDEPSFGDGFLSKSEERESGNILCSLEEAASDKTSKTKSKTCPTRERGDIEDRETVLIKSGSPESELSERTQVFELADKEIPSDPVHCGSNQPFDTPNLSPSKGVSECGGRCKEESQASGRSQLLESGKEAHFDTSKSGSVQVSHSEPTNSAAAVNHGQDVSAACGASGLRDKRAPPWPLLCGAPQSHTPFILPATSSRRPAAPAMPTLPEEEEDSAEEVDSSSSSPSTYMPVETKLVKVTIAPPTIVFPRQVSKQEPRPLEKTRPVSPRPRLSRNTSTSGPLTTVDNDGHVINLAMDELPDLQLSEEDRQKNLELLEEAKKVSDRFLTRRGRRSTCSLTDSPTGPSPMATPGSSPGPSRNSSLSAPPQTALVTDATPPASSPTRLEVPAVCDQGEANKTDHESLRKLVDWKPSEKRKVSSGTLAPRHTVAVAARQPAAAQKENSENLKPESLAPATGVAKPVPRPATQQAPCTAEIKTIGTFPPLMRAVSWDTVGCVGGRNASPKDDEGLAFSEKLKSPGYKDFPVAPVNVQKLSKLREEHKLMRTQSISGSTLPDLSETTEQERGLLSPAPCSPTAVSPADEEAKEKADAMPNISDIMLRKLKLHRGTTVACAPPLTEKEVENAFVQLSLAFRNDNYTLETRLKLAERERNLTEENTEKELEEFKNSLKGTAPLWHNAEQRESYQRLVETVAVLHRLATRLSSRAEIVGAVRQEKRLNKATEVMLQYVENLKRTYEKDHAELMEFKKLAKNSNRYCGSMETGEDGIVRPLRPMSNALGKALPRRRVSVAVVPKFNLLNIPGQSPATVGPSPGPVSGPASNPASSPASSPASGPAPSASISPAAAGPVALPVLCEANSLRSENPMDPPPQGAGETGKSTAERDGDTATPPKGPCSPEEMRAQIKAKIEEEAFNKGYQEGLKKIKELQEVKEEEESAEEKQLVSDQTAGEAEKENKSNRYEEALEAIDRLCPTIFKRSSTLGRVLILFIGLFMLVNLVNFFSNYYGEHGDTSTKSGVPGKKFFGLHVDSKSRPTPE
ncbi:uncharacterized protein mrvi1 isoform X2 [Brachyhypopomus gauderio]|uniref:uncharacterized protein mrvi1 isoform X2 n=1 Tax=Brachyhypopomus gauderio TaxID=698409 RepID=UPI004042B0FA